EEINVNLLSLEDKNGVNLQDTLPPNPKLAKKRNRAVEKQLKTDQKIAKLQEHTTLLVLGPGDSGKSTFIRQLRFLEDIERFFDPLYTPTDQDIVCCRKITTSITETKIVVNTEKIRIFDFGGQKHLRNFWAPYFDDPKNVILFFVAISSFDQQMLEDEKENRFYDTLKLFELLINMEILKKVEFILFFNKMDLFLEKLKSIKVKDYIEDFD
ncbi:guanine nucleotide-binding protein subunit alpha, partial [Clydaea vesicula]